MSYRYNYHKRKGRKLQRAGRTLIPKESAIEGEWNIIDDRSGFKIKSSQAMRTWDGYVVSKEWDEPRNPQDFVHAVRDQKPPPPNLTRPQAPFTFGNITEQELIESLLKKR